METKLWNKQLFQTILHLSKHKNKPKSKRVTDIQPIPIGVLQVGQFLLIFQGHDYWKKYFKNIFFWKIIIFDRPEINFLIDGPKISCSFYIKMTDFGAKIYDWLVSGNFLFWWHFDFCSIRIRDSDPYTPVARAADSDTAHKQEKMAK